jgi:glycerol-3-phosphate dehydrogenase
MRVTELRKKGGMVAGVRATDTETGGEYELDARVVVNATGIFSDDIRRIDDPTEERLMAPSQGVHLVLDGSFLAGNSAIMVPKTADGRVLFAVPWHGRTIVGTTDTEISDTPLESRAREDEIAFLLDHAAIYLARDPAREDVLSVYCGVRPLVRSPGDKGTAALARDHVLMISKSNLVTITGGKWTTYRKMAEDTVDTAALVAGLEERPSPTRDLRLHGWLKQPEKSDGLLSLYGSDEPAVRRVMAEAPEWGERMHERLPHYLGEAAWGARHEMARTVEDVLARRTRALLLDARASAEAAPAVARVLARELSHGANWERDQVAAYRELASGYTLD